MIEAADKEVEVEFSCPTQIGTPPREAVPCDARVQDQKPEPESKQENPEPVIDDVYYDGRHYYWPRENAVGYMAYNLTDVRRELKRLGYRPKPLEGEPLSEIDFIISAVNRERYLDRAGPLAGHRCGLVRDSITGHQVLVTSEPRLIVPKEGEFPVIDEFLTNLLGEQGIYFLSWMASSVRNLYGFLDGKENYRPGPAIALCGPRACGKTLLITIIGVVFGRQQSAYHWLTGSTNFNSELMGSELLTFDDESGHTDIRIRKGMGNRIKSGIFSGTVKGEQKGKEAFTIRPWWRIVIATNDEPEDLRILPTHDDSMLDKLSLFKCYPHEIVMPDADPTERWAGIEAELPAFVHYLRHEFVLPEEIFDRRTGAKAYQHPDLVAALAAMDPAAKLLQLIDERLESRLPGVFTASEIERYLTERDSPTCREAKILLQYANSCGT